jgi:hypothetical protein
VRDESILDELAEGLGAKWVRPNGLGGLSGYYGKQAEQEERDQAIYQLPEIEPVAIYTQGDAVTVIHGGTALTHTFGSTGEASEYAEGLRAELFEEYAAVADEALSRFMRQAIGRRNG